MSTSFTVRGEPRKASQKRSRKVELRKRQWERPLRFGDRVSWREYQGCTFYRLDPESPDPYLHRRRITHLPGATRRAEVMPETLTLLSFNRTEFTARYRAAARGDETALAELEAIFDGYTPLSCFLCDREVEGDVFALMLPERRDHSRVLAAPLCQQCRVLPSMQRMARAIKLLKKMWGKGTHFTFTPRRC